MPNEVRIPVNPAQYEALRVILNHENISYQTGMGPGCFAVTVDKKDEKSLKKAIQQWQSAISGIVSSIP